MPSRNLPNTHVTRDKAFLKAFTKYTNTPVAERLLSATQFTQWLDLASPASLYSRWKKEREEAAAALAGQTGLTSGLPARERILRLNISHFIQTLNNAIERGSLPASQRALFELPVSSDAVPPLDSEDDLLLWAGRVATGEAARQAAGGPPLAWPSAEDVADALADYLSVANPQSTAKDHASEEQRDVLALVPEADHGIRKMWDAIEYHLSEQDLEGSALRERAREWGVVYDDDPALPATPTLTHAFAAGVLTLTMTAPGATLFKIYEKAPGAATFTLEAEGVPTGWTKPLPASSGTWTYQVTALAADGTTEGDPSNSVTLEA